MNFSMGLTSVLVTILLLNLSLPNREISDKGFIQELDSITIMSYNIRFDNPDDGVNAWPNRKEYVADMIGKKYQADIIGIQEALKHQLDDLKQQLPEYDWVGVGRDDGKNRGEFSPIFYRADRFELVATNTFWLSESPHQPGSKSWDAAITRIVTWAIFTDLNSKRDFYVINTHFDHIGEEARVESSKLIAEFVSEIENDIPIIITGDLNVPETAKAYSVLSEHPEIHDARYLSESGHDGPTATFNNWSELRPAETRIDYIFVNNSIRVLNHKIADDKYEGYYPSDHLPVISDILFNVISR